MTELADAVMMIDVTIAMTIASVVTGINSCLGTEEDATYLGRMMITENVDVIETTSEVQKTVTEDAEAEEAMKTIVEDADVEDISAAVVASDFSGNSIGTPVKWGSFFIQKNPLNVVYRGLGKLFYTFHRPLDHW
ncbi:hypothetical protein CN378_02455 [Bacillus sp. AFS015802]|uniref:hypothetical protein n=1 Tax=Bacillus sp. AFS015802 TaxID=2033486 RepID=UPI000BFA2850|nr:hypothetical protein [Bacillus sp. AFS015802]PFA69649.1 hypothetical protein CN378_02455 [Bacillus sp. AFS015802]